MKRGLSILLGLALLLGMGGAFFNAQSAYAKEETWRIEGRENVNKESTKMFDREESYGVLCEPTPLVQKETTARDEWEMRSVTVDAESSRRNEGEVIQIREDICEPEFQTRASYDERLLSYVHELYVNDVLVAWVVEDCTVWYYTDGKVHLYRRVLTLHIGNTYFEPSYIRYGRIVNTDGSCSYTSGDEVTFSNGTRSQTYALEFYVTHDNYRFWRTQIS